MKKLICPNSIKSRVIIILISYVITIPIELNSQGKINVGVGLDIFEKYNINIRYQGDQTQYALGVGTYSFEDLQKYKKILSISAGWYYHFHGVSAYTSKRPWYGRVVVNYIKREYGFAGSYTNHKINHLLFGLRLGREFNLTKSLAINSDIGFNFGAVNKIISTGGFSSGIWIFYRF